MNYDILLERALEAAGVPFRLFPTRYERILFDGGGGIVDQSRDDEIVVSKVHGSVDWFSRAAYSERVQQNRVLDYVPRDPLFGPESLFTIKPIADGPRPTLDPFKNLYRLDQIEDFYRDPPLFLSSPALVSPSTEKLVYTN